jgi:SAM-dependent methyltransferase
MTDYDDRFFDWVNATARKSAQVMLPIVAEQTRPSSVVDIGCGQGAWLEHWASLGVHVTGIDGSHVDQDRLLIPRENFSVVNLAKPWDVARRFDLAQSLEVAEHLPSDVGPAFVATLCSLADIVLFSAARPGQGGERHINERIPSYWAGLFRTHGYLSYDSVRPLMAAQHQVAPWYRYNSMLFANATGVARLSLPARRAVVSDVSQLDVVGDWKWKARCAALRPLPEPVVTWMSKMRYRLVMAGQG